APVPVAAPAPSAPIALSDPEPDPDPGTGVHPVPELPPADMREEVTLAEAVIPEAEPEPAPAPPPPPPAPEPAPSPALPPVGSVELRDELVRLRRYVGSFTGSLRGARDPKVTDGIRQRIQREVERVRDLFARHSGADHESLLAQLEATVAAA